jgi:hypothetical protein
VDIQTLAARITSAMLDKTTASLPAKTIAPAVMKQALRSRDGGAAEEAKRLAAKTKDRVLYWTMDHLLHALEWAEERMM